MGMEKTQKHDMDMLHGSITDKFLKFALPLVLTGVCQQLFTTADTIVLGQFTGKEAMAAVGSNAPVISMLVSLFLGLSLGANVVIAQAIGARKWLSARHAVHTSLLLGLVIGIVLTVIGELLTSTALEILAVPEEVMRPAETYLRIMLVCLPAMSLYNFAAAIFRSRGNGRTPLMALFVASVLNILLDIASVLLLEDSVAGVAWGTVLANALSAIILIWALPYEPKPIQLDWRALHWSREELMKTLRIGLPAGIQGVVFALANILIQNAINSLGPDVMAASAAAYVIEINVYCLLLGLGQTTTTFVGQNYGAGNLRRCFRITRIALVIDIVAITALSLSCWFFARPILAFFTDDPAVIAFGIVRIFYVTIPQPLNGMIEVLSGALRGYGYSLPPALLALFTICGMRIVWLATVFRWQPDFSSLMLVYPTSWLLTVCLLFGVYAICRRRLHPGAGAAQAA